MKIALVGPFYPYRGGISSFNRMLYRSLVKENSLLVVNFSRLYPGIVFPGRTQYEEHIRSSEDISIRLIDSINPLTWYQAAKVIVDFDPEVLIFHHWHVFFAFQYGIILRFVKKKRKSCKTIVICHNIFPHERMPFGDSILKYFFRVSDGFILLAGKLEKDLRNLIKEPLCRVSPHPLYSQFGSKINKQKARERLGIKEKRVVLYFGLVRKYKGIEHLIKAVDKVLEKFDVRFLIVGEFYVKKKEYLELVNSIRRFHKVTIVDRYIPDEEVSTYFSAADVVVLPYVSATQSGIVKIAYHFEVPCIVTNVGGLKEDVKDGETGFVVEPGSELSLAEAIVKYFKDDCERKFIENIKATKSKYSWERFVSDLMELYRELK